MRPARPVLGDGGVLRRLHAPIEMGQLIIVPSPILPAAFVETARLFVLPDRDARILAAPLVAAFRLRFGRQADKAEADDETCRKEIRAHPSLHLVRERACYVPLHQKPCEMHHYTAVFATAPGRGWQSAIARSSVPRTVATATTATSDFNRKILRNKIEERSSPSSPYGETLSRAFSPTA